MNVELQGALESNESFSTKETMNAPEGGKLTAGRLAREPRKLLFFVPMAPME